MTAAAKTVEFPEAEPETPVIVFGRDGAGKAHASLFTPEHAEAARTAAGEMGFAAVGVTAEGLEAISATLPAGRLFASGRAFVPFVKGAVYDELVKHLPAGTLMPALRLVAGSAAASGELPKPMAEPAKSEAGAGPKPDLPTDWTQIKAGSVVLATEGGGDGWFEAVVVVVRPMDLIELRWRDYPGFANFIRHRSALALLYPHPKI